MQDIFTLKWEGGELVLIDQTLLPNDIKYITCKTVEDIYNAIKIMQVRGAPAIGVAAAYGMSIAGAKAPSENKQDFFTSLIAAGEYLKTSRPTAVNLMWAVDRMIAKAKALHDLPIDDIKVHLEAEAIAIHQEDKCINRNIGENLLSLLKDGDTVLTHCNAGSLATSEYGTALSAFYIAKEKGINIKAYADETRPRLQGAHLTCFELYNAGIDVTLICDNMAAVVMAQKKVDAVIVGCDRIAANGDTANKIGTFNVSILAKYFGIPMYIAAPTPTIDMQCKTGADIPIEERSPEEVLCINDKLIAPKGMKVYNPAFDVTPAENITAIVTEKGIVYPPFLENLEKIIK
jgi:methylthioribose-1-phosphate isomerase